VNMAKENIIISLGGSLVAPARNASHSDAGGPGEIDTAFLKSFRAVVKKHLPDKRFFIFVGGGKVCRAYQQALLEFGGDMNERDLMGIEVSRLNAWLVKQLFGDAAFSEVITNPTKTISTRKDVVVAGGWKPGWSTDYCAVILAKNMGIKTIVNLSNIDYVYDKDPNKHKDAKQIKSIGWQEFRGIVGNKWTPGLSSPFDPRASKMAEVLKIKVAVINGKHLERLQDFLRSKEFIGTTIQ